MKASQTLAPKDPSKRAAAYGLAAAISILFNTALTLAKEAYEPLRHFMVALSGHHWVSQGLIDLLVYVILGELLLRKSIPTAGVNDRLAFTIAAAVVIAGAGLCGWFLWF